MSTARPISHASCPHLDALVGGAGGLGRARGVVVGRSYGEARVIQLTFSGTRVAEALPLATGKRNKQKTKEEIVGRSTAWLQK